MNNSYYNPSTNEVKSIVELRKLFNASIPSNKEEFNNWYKLYTNIPSYTSNQCLIKDTIKFINGKYYETYIVVDKSKEQLEKEYFYIQKNKRADAVSKITVEIDGMIFDGDEVSQERMSRTVVAAAATGETGDATTTWVLHDNTIAQPTISQLARALRAAGEEQTKLWTIPYEDTEAVAV